VDRAPTRVAPLTTGVRPRLSHDVRHRIRTLPGFLAGDPARPPTAPCADTYARELLTLPEGAIGYLLKDRVNRVRDFAVALETVASGGTVIDPDVVQHLLGGSRPGPLDSLTTREREVLALMVDGQSNAAIASTLTLSDAAVSKHIGNIFSKLGLSPVEDNRRVRAVLTYLQAASR